MKSLVRTVGRTLQSRLISSRIRHPFASVRALATMSAPKGAPQPPPVVDESARSKVHPDACLSQPPEYWWVLHPAHEAMGLP